MKRIKEKILYMLELSVIILFMWAIISNGMAGIVGPRGGLIWGAFITGLVLFSIHIYYKEKDKQYNEEMKTDMNKNLLSKPILLSEKEAEKLGDALNKAKYNSEKKALSQDWYNRALRNANEVLRREGKIQNPNFLRRLLFKMRKRWKSWLWRRVMDRSSKQMIKNFNKSLREGNLPEVY